ncbi:MAG: WG repeat-containing protein [Bacteroidia bacterium]
MCLRLIGLLILTTLCPIIIVAQSVPDLLAVFKDKQGNYGYIAPTGKVVVSPQYKDAKAFSDGIALVKMKKPTGEIRYGYIDKAGKFIKEPDFYNATEFKDGIALVRVKSKTGELRYGYIDKTCKFVIEPIYIYASEFSEGLAAVQLAQTIVDKDTKTEETIVFWAYINKKGNVVYEESQLKLSSRISFLGNFINGVAPVSVFEFTETITIERAKLGINEPIEGKNATNNALDIDNDDLILSQKNSSAYQYINNKGVVVINKIFTKASKFQEGLAMVEFDKQTAFIDKKGEVKFVVDFTYADNTKNRGFKNGYLPFISTKGKYGVIDNKGRVVVPPDYEYIGEFN